ncbi:MAG: hypothetical protein LPK02_14740 [Rhodobacterales bacterium]|nr:hypothetical protein [Rhodobacterales bacterium]
MSEPENASFAQDAALVILSNLDELLDRERSALLEGDLDGISRSLREKERLIDMLNALPPSAELRLTSIRHKVQRNQVLLDGALEGIRSVAERLSALRRIRDTLETYDQTGQKTVLDGLRPGRVEKRA